MHSVNSTVAAVLAAIGRHARPSPRSPRRASVRPAKVAGRRAALATQDEFGEPGCVDGLLIADVQSVISSDGRGDRWGSQPDHRQVDRAALRWIEIVQRSDRRER